MKCPYCSHKETKVLDKRETEDLSVTRRRRQCLKCKKRFTTYEKIESELLIIKKDGRRERFDRNKLLSGILKSCEKRAITREKVENLIDDLQTELRTLGKSEIPSKKIGEMVMRKLKKLDKVAYIRFASVYREFADIKSFEKELRKLSKKKLRLF